METTTTDPLAGLLDAYRLQGDEAAFEELIRRTRPRLLRIAGRIGHSQDAEDTVQSAYHSLLRREAFPHGYSITGWLITATVRLAYRRKAQAARATQLADQLATAATDSTPLPSAVVAEERELLLAAIDQLPAAYRDVLVLHHLQGLSVVDTARLLDVNPSTVKTRLHRGRAMLQSRLGARLYAGLLSPIWFLRDWMNPTRPTRGRHWLALFTVAVATALILQLVPLDWSPQPNDPTARPASPADSVTPGDESQARVAMSDTPGEADDPSASEETSRPVASPPGATTVATAGHTLRGTILDETGDPVPQAWVSVSNLPTVLSDAAGEFEIHGISVDTVKVFVIALERTSHSQEIDLAAEPLRIVLQPQGETVLIAGIVVDEFDRPVVSAKISAQGNHATSGAHGEFELTVPIATRTVEARHPLAGAGEVSLSPLAPGDRSTVRIRLEPGETIVGTVRTEGGVGIAGAQVRAWRTGLSSGIATEARTDTGGRFRLTGLKEGAHRVTAMHRDFLHASTTASAGVEDLTLVMEAGAAARGRVDCDDPLVGAKVVATWTDSTGETHVQDYRVQEDGSFEARQLPPGPITLHAVAAGGAKGRSVSLTLHPLEDREGVLLPLTVGSESLSGTVVDSAGSPLDLVFVVAVKEDASPVHFPSLRQRARALFELAVFSESDGTFEIAGLERGRYHLFASKDGYQVPWEPLARCTAPAENVRLVLPPGGRIDGRVLDERGDPMPNLRLRLEPANPNPLLRLQAIQERAAADGTFRFASLAPGDYVLECSGESRIGGVLLTQAVSLVSGEDAEVELRIAACETRVRVVNETGSPIAGASVVWMEADPSSPDAPHGYATTDEDGRCVLHGLPRTAVDVWASANGRFDRDDDRPPVMCGEEVTIELWPLGGLEGQVFLAGDQDVQRIDVWLLAGKLPAARVGTDTIDGRLSLGFDQFPRFDAQAKHVTGLALWARGHGLARVDLPQFDPLGTNEIGSVTLSPGSSELTGVVRDREGMPVPGLRVSAQFDWRGRYLATSDARGEFALEVPPGRFRVWLMRDRDVQQLPDWHEVQPGEELQLELTWE